MISLICIDVYAIRIRKSGVFALLIRMALYQVLNESIFTLKLLSAYELVNVPYVTWDNLTAFSF